MFFLSKRNLYLYWKRISTARVEKKEHFFFPIGMCEFWLFATAAAVVVSDVDVTVLFEMRRKSVYLSRIFQKKEGHSVVIINWWICVNDGILDVEKWERKQQQQQKSKFVVFFSLCLMTDWIIWVISFRFVHLSLSLILSSIRLTNNHHLQSIAHVKTIGRMRVRVFLSFALSLHSVCAFDCAFV